MENKRRVGTLILCQRCIFVSLADCKDHDCTTTLDSSSAELTAGHAAGRDDVILRPSLDPAPLQNYRLVILVGIKNEAKEANFSAEYSVVIQGFRIDLRYEVFLYVNQDKCG